MIRTSIFWRPSPVHDIHTQFATFMDRALFGSEPQGSESLKRIAFSANWYSLATDIPTNLRATMQNPLQIVPVWVAARVSWRALHWGANANRHIKRRTGLAECSQLLPTPTLTFDIWTRDKGAWRSQKQHPQFDICCTSTALMLVARVMSVTVAPKPKSYPENSSPLQSAAMKAGWSSFYESSQRALAPVMIQMIVLKGAFLL